MRKYLSIVIIAMCTSAFVQAGADGFQKAVENFGWFPEGTYVFWQYYDQQSIRKEKAYSEYFKFFIEPADLNVTFILPPSMKDFDSEARAILTKLKVTNKNNVDKYGLNFDVEFAGDELYVYRYSDLNSLLKNAISRSEVVDSGDTVFGRTIYTYKSMDLELKRKQFFAYATDTGEWLVAGKPENIKAMVKAGMGKGMSILDNELFAELAEVIPELGQYWYAWSGRPDLESQIQILKNNKGSREKIDSWTEKAEKGLQFRIETLLFSDDITLKRISIYGDEDYGKQHYLDAYRDFKNPSQMPPDYATAINKKRKDEWRKGRFTMTVVYDREMLESERKMRENRRKLALGRMEKVKK